jgi:7-cyano-7-deazaguanine synthase
MVVERFSTGQGTAVLFSGGLDSAVLLADAVRRASAGGPMNAHGPLAVQPLYVSVGLAWEAEERAMIAKLLATPPFANVKPMVTLHADMRDVYPETHWAIRGTAPAYDTPDEDVYIEGRNIVLLAKAAVFMARAGLATVLIGPLAGNPFPDASNEFFRAMSAALSTGLAAPIAIEAPLSKMHKADVVKLGAALGVAMELTLSCMQPSGGKHCGACSKCRERMDGFKDAGVPDPTFYEKRR